MNTDNQAGVWRPGEEEPSIPQKHYFCETVNRINGRITRDVVYRTGVSSWDLDPIWSVVRYIDESPLPSAEAVSEQTEFKIGTLLNALKCIAAVSTDDGARNVAIKAMNIYKNAHPSPDAGQPSGKEVEERAKEYNWKEEVKRLVEFGFIADGMKSRKANEKLQREFNQFWERSGKYALAFTSLKLQTNTANEKEKELDDILRLNRDTANTLKRMVGFLAGAAETDSDAVDFYEWCIETGHGANTHENIRILYQQYLNR